MPAWVRRLQRVAATEDVARSVVHRIGHRGHRTVRGVSANNSEEAYTPLQAVPGSAPPEVGDALGMGTLHGVKWSYLSTIGSLVVQVGYTAAISRLLPPAAFGTVVLAQVVLRFGTYFSQMGIGPAVVQAQVLEDDDVEVAFTLSTFLGAIFTLGFAVLSPVSSWVFRDPALTSVVAWMAPVFVLVGMGAVANALLRRQLRFRALAAIDFGSYVLAYPIVGVALAWGGHGTESLVAAAVVQAALLSSFSWLAVRHRVRPRWDHARASRLLHFGGWVSLTGFMEFLGGNADTLAVGRFLGTAMLGQYNRATLLAVLPAYQVVSNANRVLLSSFSRIQDQKDRFRQAYVGGTAMLLAGVVPIVAVTIALAAPLVEVLFGPQWQFSATLVPYVGIAAMLDRLHSFPALLAEARGKVGIAAGIQALHLVVAVTLVAAVVARHGGAKELAIAWASGQAVTYVVYLVYTQRQLQPDSRQLAQAHVECLLLAAAGVMPAAVFANVGSMPAIARVVGGGITAVALYFAVLTAIPGLLVRREFRRLGLEELLVRSLRSHRWRESK